MIEQIQQREVNVKPVAYAENYLCASQRMSAKFKKIIVNTYLIPCQYVLPDLRQQYLRRSPRGDVEEKTRNGILSTLRTGAIKPRGCV